MGDEELQLWRYAMLSGVETFAFGGLTASQQIELVDLLVACRAVTPTFALLYDPKPGARGAVCACRLVDGAPVIRQHLVGAREEFIAFMRELRAELEASERRA